MTTEYEHKRCVRDTLIRLSRHALDGGWPDLSVIYSESAIRLGFEIIEEGARRLREINGE